MEKSQREIPECVVGRKNILMTEILTLSIMDIDNIKLVGDFLCCAGIANCLVVMARSGTRHMRAREVVFTVEKESSCKDNVGPACAY